MIRAIALILVTGLVVSICPAGDVGFTEDFALAKDRAAALKGLIPGTEDYYYYACLDQQNHGRLDEVDKLLAAWLARRNGDRNERIVEIENRQALLRYDKQPAQALEYLTRAMDLRFDHQRQVTAKGQLPTALDAKTVSRGTLSARAMAAHSGTLEGFEPASLEWLAAAADELKLDAAHRHDLLHRLDRPDVPGLPALVVDDIHTFPGGSFGMHTVHSLLLLSQLDECLKLEPALLSQGAFVDAYLPRLGPDNDSDWRTDDKARQAYLERLWSFVTRLDPAHNSLKAHVLYHRLAHDRALGVYDKDRFLAYLALPRRAPYANPKYLEGAQQQQPLADLTADFQTRTFLPPIGNDEPLVRDYLAHFFQKEDDWKPYGAYLDDAYLKRLLAETKILLDPAGAERWIALLDPGAFKDLKERVDIDFASTNKTYFAAGDKVALDVHVKNVGKLIVKVFEINAMNYYRENAGEVGTDIPLDGLAANEERIEPCGDSPLPRMTKTLAFPGLDKPGLYVVELIGNGKSSRALIRKGRLHHLVATSTAGHVFTVLDEANNKAPAASLWMAGHEYKPAPDGKIVVPFSTKPGQQQIILSDGRSASLAQFDHQPESYQLSAGIYVDRESLLARQKATVIVRPALALNGTPVTLSVLEDVRLVLTSTDHDGVTSTKEVTPFKLSESAESTHEFQVPARLGKIHFTLKAKVQNVSLNQKQDLSASADFVLNQIDTTEKIEDVHFSHLAGGYVLDVLGKTGEPKADRPVHVVIKHRLFTDPAQVDLQTDAAGRIALGELSEVDFIHVTIHSGVQHGWQLPRDAHSMASLVQGQAGRPVELPYVGSAGKPDRAELSLLELRGEAFVADRFDAISIKDGLVVISDLPAGDYDLLIKPTAVHVRIRLTDGLAREGYVLSPTRLLETVNPKPLQIADVSAGKDEVRIRLANATASARVHVLATRFMPEYSPYAQLAGVPHEEPQAVLAGKVASVYVVGRDIGDEYRYIIERRYAKKFPGVMLARPTLLLNPWDLHETKTDIFVAGGSGDFGMAAAAAAGGPAPCMPASAAGRANSDMPFFANLDFLARPSVVLANLAADKDGLVVIPRKLLTGRQQIHVVAVDDRNTAYRELAMEDSPARPRDLRFQLALDTKKHFAEQKQVTVVPAKGTFSVADILTSPFETYDTLGKAFSLYVTLLADNPEFNEFSFLLGWGKFTDAQKAQKYAKYASHELHFFLYKKDPAYFEKVVAPYLKNKKDKTFMDHYLLGADLKGYLAPWAYERLNVAERILLADRLAEERPAARRAVGDAFDLIPPDVERFNFLFQTALGGSSLEATDLLGLRRAVAVQARKKSVGWFAAKPGESEKLVMGAPSADAEPAGEEGGEADAKAGLVKVEALVVPAAVPSQSISPRRLYQAMGQTREWAESNYYHTPIEKQDASLIPVNAFWRDYAEYVGSGKKGPFLSGQFPYACTSRAGALLALAVLDLPFEAPKHESRFDDAAFTLTAGGGLVVFHKEIKETPLAAEKTILVNQNYFRHDDRYRHVNNEQVDKFVTDEFLVQAVYGCQVVVTNTTSSRQKLDVLLQIPRGSMPVLNGQETRGVHVRLEPFSTQKIEYYFYFPQAGAFDHYAVHVAREGKLIAAAECGKLNAVTAFSKVDMTSWDWVSQNGTPEQVLEFLRAANLARVDLGRIAWRMGDKGFFQTVTGLLAERHVYHDVLWSYALKHDSPAAAREYLKHRAEFVDRCGPYIDCTLLTIDPVERRAYQHLEYWPLVNARAHRLGAKRQILNDRLFVQYSRLMNILCFRPALDNDDRMAVVYYLLLQDRVEEAGAFFESVEPAKLATALQYDYAKVYLAFCREDVQAARATAAAYKDHPVERWRNLFATALAQLDEIDGKGAAKVVDDKDRTALQGALAAGEPSLDFTIDAQRIRLNYQALTEVRVNYYPMDIELLFSRNPFVQQVSGPFSMIRPNHSETVALPAGAGKTDLPLPKQFLKANVMVEIVAGPLRKSQAYYANAMAVQVVENYGQVTVASAESGKALPKIYVKVYARMAGGGVQFYKDGYTDMRGKFDYTSLNGDTLDNVEKFALLILGETDGAVVREASPPKR
ncbi:MAG: hypothetical protein NT031_17655 [Planctomycetota bacterium]|nr:hypothetical protein [Planctomycetota bacterium]